MRKHTVGETQCFERLRPKIHEPGRPAVDAGSRRRRAEHTDERSDCGYGNGVRSTPCTTLNTAVVAPIPSASVRRATAVNPGARASIRARMAEVALKVVQPGERASVAMKIFRVCDVADRPSRGEPSLASTASSPAPVFVLE